MEGNALLMRSSPKGAERVIRLNGVGGILAGTVSTRLQWSIVMLRWLHAPERRGNADALDHFWTSCQIFDMFASKI
jgi:hypothetical protein